MKNKAAIIALAAVIFTASSVGFIQTASAHTKNPTTSWKASQANIKNYLQHAPGVTGTVSAIDGTTITVLGKNGTSYTVLADNAKILKNRNTILAITDVKIGDTVMVQGTVDGTTITATTIFDGKLMLGKHKHGFAPGVMGTVQGVSGTTITLLGKNSTTYTVDASKAKILKGSPTTTISLTDIQNGDTLMIRGTVSGTTVIAKNIFDGNIGHGHGVENSQ